MRYFAYGGNMSSEQMNKRCPDAKMMGIGFLPGYELVFNRKGTYHAGAVGSIEPSTDADAAVHGVIWEMTHEDLEKMDTFENPEAYQRKLLDIATEDEEQHECQVYIAFPQEHNLKPDPVYLERIISAAEEMGLPRQYIDKLKRFRS